MTKFERIDEDTVQLTISLKEAVIIKSLLSQVSGLYEETRHLFCGIDTKYASISEIIYIKDDGLEKIERIVYNDIG
jgi:hypothetical protein